MIYSFKNLKNYESNDYYSRENKSYREEESNVTGFMQCFNRTISSKFGISINNID